MDKDTEDFLKGPPWKSQVLEALDKFPSGIQTVVYGNFYGLEEGFLYIRIRNSVVDPGYYYISIASTGSAVDTKRPVAKDAVPSFLDHMVRGENAGTSVDLGKEDWGSTTIKRDDLKPSKFRDGEWVYFIRSKDNAGPIKIGSAVDVEKRLHAIQLMSPSPLKVIGAMRGGRKEEGALHRRFRALRSHGEWFSPGRELLDFIRESTEGGEGENRTGNSGLQGTSGGAEMASDERPGV